MTVRNATFEDMALAAEIMVTSFRTAFGSFVFPETTDTCTNPAKDEIILKNWLYAMVIPVGVELDVPDDLKHRTIYVENDCRDIWDWSEKVYQTIEKR